MGAPIVVQRLSNLTSIHEDMGSIPGLAKNLALPWAVIQTADTARVAWILTAGGCARQRWLSFHPKPKNLKMKRVHPKKPKKKKKKKEGVTYDLLKATLQKLDKWISDWMFYSD